MRMRYNLRVNSDVRKLILGDQPSMQRAPGTSPSSRSKTVLGRCFQCALMASIGSPFGYAALRYIDYPTQILGKSCKLVPVMLMNIVLYRRKFALHKYIVVGTVTLGISLFMLYAPSSSSRGGHGTGKQGGAATNSLLGIGLLLVNLLVDGAINSTQDEVFVKYKIQGIQMMLIMNVFATLITTISMLVPLPEIPIISSPAPAVGVKHSELSSALAFINSHPQVLKDILLFSTAGALGQLFIFDTLENFGSLTLVTITVTRKLFTMLLSLVVYNHRLTPGQSIGVVTVFAGIGIEAYVKRSEALEKKRRKLESLRKDADLLGAGADGKSDSSNNGHVSGSVTPIRMKDI